MEQKELIIIGAGPAGLRAGEEAQRLGLDYLILERGSVAQAWREIRANMPMLSPSHPSVTGPVYLPVFQFGNWG